MATTTKRPKSRRTSELSAIHTLRSKLRMPEDSYRAMLSELTGFSSAGDLVTSTERQKVIDHMRGLERDMGLADGRSRKPAAARRGSEMGFADDDSPRVNKIRTMWLRLHDVSEVEAATAEALNKWVHRQTGSMLSALDNHQLNKVIEELKKWHLRLGLTD